MKYKILFFKGGKAKLTLAAALLAMLTGCMGNGDGPHYAVSEQPPVFAAQDDYVYYPGYDVYYSSSRHQYASLEGGAWVSRPAPRGVSVDTLRASTSVKMDFHDSPAQHHAEVVQKYPKNWSPAPAKQDQTDDKRDESKDNNGK